MKLWVDGISGITAPQLRPLYIWTQDLSGVTLNDSFTTEQYYAEFDGTFSSNPDTNIFWTDSSATSAPIGLLKKGLYQVYGALFWKPQWGHLDLAWSNNGTALTFLPPMALAVPHAESTMSSTNPDIQDEDFLHVIQGFVYKSADEAAPGGCPGLLYRNLGASDRVTDYLAMSVFYYGE